MLHNPTLSYDPEAKLSKNVKGDSSGFDCGVIGQLEKGLY